MSLGVLSMLLFEFFICKEFKRSSLDGQQSFEVSWISEEYPRFEVLCALCICMFPGLAMAEEYPMQPQEMSSPPPSSLLPIHKHMQMKPMSPKQREEEVKKILVASGYKSLSKLVGELLTQGIIANGSSTLTLFAPSDEAFEKYILQSMDPRRILGYHTVKGLFSSPDLARLPVGTKLHTILPGHSQSSLALALALRRSAPSAYGHHIENARGPRFIIIVVGYHQFLFFFKKGGRTGFNQLCGHR